ncbi:LacI family transcriptional regulator [Streptomyces bingchenggensis BCW-1]|uniref:LacI family transcriptional regulator n=1 Tax=Streptomyces bingchenggensis (strain BCW-1) TaxID=749414 RepID=D7BW42_STRBB|nr:MULTISPECIES: LacI family DNA-binding transcriptional regulator [Streptomyces]ADI11752.1 LacI family transcriptional regulator [Streptomyces bingchenggensis BCW-1]
MTGGPTESTKPERVTLSDIARAAGVSVATASRTLNGSTRTVRPETRERVLEAVSRLGYEANVTAQAVGRRLSPTVALVVRDIRERYFARIAHGVIAEAAASGIAVTVTAIDSYPDAEFDRLRSLRGQRPGGLIVVDPAVGDENKRLRFLKELEAYTLAGIPVVVIGTDTLDSPSVMFSEFQGAHALGRLLVRRGYRNPLLLSGEPHWPAITRRVDGVESALAEAGVALHRTAALDLTRDAGYGAVMALTDTDLHGSDVLVCASDAVAFGAATALRRRGVSVGSDIAISGFEDGPGATDVRPALTTVRLPLIEAGAQAFRMASSPTRVRQVLLDAELVVRASTPDRTAA